MRENENVWHCEVIGTETQRALENLRKFGVLEGFYLAGVGVSGIVARTTSIFSVLILWTGGADP